MSRSNPGVSDTLYGVMIVMAVFLVAVIWTVVGIVKTLLRRYLQDQL